MKQKLPLSLAIICALLVAGYFFVGAQGTHSRPTSELLNEASATQILDHIRSLNSPLVLVNFWASWCEPCKQEFPDLLTLKEQYAKRGLQIVFVSIDGERELVAAEDFLRERHVAFKSFYRGSQDVEFVSKIFPKWEGAVPASVLIGPKMEIVDSWEGENTLEEFKKHINSHLSGS